MIEQQEQLIIGGISTTELVDQFSTPLYVYDAQKIRHQYRRLADAFGSQCSDFLINYAVKANTNPDIVDILVQEGAGLDTASKAEIDLAEAVNADEILFTAPYNTKEEIAYARRSSAILNVDSAFILDKIDDMPNEICFRIDPGIGKGEYGLAFGGGDTKFGIPETQAIDVYKRAKNRGASRFGIHMMTGSNIRDPHYFGEITEKLVTIAGSLSEELTINFDFIDIGGGLGIPYKPDDQELDIEQTASIVTDALARGKQKYDIGDPQLWIEPGRYLVAQAGVLLTTVTGVKEKGGTVYVGVDTGMHHNIRPMLLDGYHEIVVANDCTRPNDGEKTIVGPVCSSIDTMAQDRSLPHIEQGDILAIRDIGAYGFTLASHFNSRPLPAEVLVDSGTASVIRKREQPEAIFHGTTFTK